MARAVRHAWHALQLADVLALSAWAQSYRNDDRETADLAVYGQGSATPPSPSPRSVPCRGGGDRAAFVHALVRPSRDYLGHPPRRPGRAGCARDWPSPRGSRRERGQGPVALQGPRTRGSGDAAGVPRPGDGPQPHRHRGRLPAARRRRRWSSPWRPQGSGPTASPSAAATGRSGCAACSPRAATTSCTRTPRWWGSAARLLAPRGTVLLHTEHNTWDRYHPATRAVNALTIGRNHRVWAVSDEVARSIRVPVAWPPTPGRGDAPRRRPRHRPARVRRPAPRRVPGSGSASTSSSTAPSATWPPRRTRARCSARSPWSTGCCATHASSSSAPARASRSCAG